MIGVGSGEGVATQGEFIGVIIFEQDGMRGAAAYFLF